MRSPDMYDLALLNGGPQLAITTAATRLHRDGVLRDGGGQTLAAVGELDPPAHQLEREVFEAVRCQSPVSVAHVRSQLEGSDAIASMTAELTNEGLLLDEARASHLHTLWIAGIGLAALAAVGILAGALSDVPVGLLAAVVGAVALVTYKLAPTRPRLTARGRAVVKDRRKERADLRRLPQAGESAMTVALFGGAALWLADPAIAGTLGVPREEARHLGGSGGGGCSAGGSCAGGGGSGGGGGGGGGCGGGGCGGGGG